MALPLPIIADLLALWDGQGHYSLASWQEAQEQAALLAFEQTPFPERALGRLGFTIEYKPLSVVGLWVWGRVVPSEKRVYLDREALAFLYKNSSAWPEELSANPYWPERLVLAHELFHILATRRKIKHSELAAVIFSFNCLFHKCEP